jgi:hypothetical protein
VSFSTTVLILVENCRKSNASPKPLSNKNMKSRKIKFACWLGQFSMLLLAVCAGGAVFAQTQSNVQPNLCIESFGETGNIALAANAAVNASTITVTSGAPAIGGRVTLNPGAANQETFKYVLTSETTLNLVDNSFPAFLTKAHTAGEPVVWQGNSIIKAGYYNPNPTTVTISVGPPLNYFSPQPTIFPNHTRNFLPGYHANAFVAPVLIQERGISWVLGKTDGSGGYTIFTLTKDSGLCAKLTYQGRLSNGGAAATGNYDLTFTLFDRQTGGAVQSHQATAANVAVTNGVFTVVLDFGAFLKGSNAARFMEIGVRPASQNQSDPYTVLQPRQPLTDVPYAVNAQKAFDVQLILTGGVPSTVDCDSASEYGQARVDATNLKLYICTAAGWKSATLQ